MPKLQDLRTVFICPDHNEKYARRKEHMFLLLKDYTNAKHFKSGTENYPSCLLQAFIDILEAHMDDEPLLLLEDDVAFVAGRDDVEIPEGADAVYLGLSIFRGSRTINHSEGLHELSAFSGTQVRVLNMLATHAIVYVSRAYKQAVVDALKPYLGIDYHSDVLISRLHSSFLILANKKPSFYQSSEFNPQSRVQIDTDIEILSQLDHGGEHIAFVVVEDRTRSPMWVKIPPSGKISVNVRFSDGSLQVMLADVRALFSNIPSFKRNPEN